MSRRTPTFQLIAMATLASATLAGCASPRPQTTATRASAAAAASCRASTESSFNRQNRYLLSERNTTDAPFSNSGVSGITTRGLTQQYDYGSQLQDCLTASGGGAARSTDSQPAPPTGTPRAPY